MSPPTNLFKLICNLEDYVLEIFANGTSRGRAGEILCLIPPIKSISNELVEAVQVLFVDEWIWRDSVYENVRLARSRCAYSRDASFPRRYGPDFQVELANERSAAEAGND